MTTNKTDIARLAELAAVLPALIAQLDTARRDLAGQMQTLKDQGLIYATEHMKDGKYLTLLYPIRQGEPRRREYIGNDPERMAKARAAVQRAKDYDALAKEAARIDSQAAEGYSCLHRAVSQLRGDCRNDYRYG